MSACAPCTCGGKFAGGTHSDWCDSLRPAEPEPTPSSAPATMPSWYNARTRLIRFVDGRWVFA